MIFMAILIDATDMVLGRLASIVAKKALRGEEVIVINAERAIVAGNRENILRDYRTKREFGDLYKGPFFPRMPDRLVRRTIRGMMPWHKTRGMTAFRKIKVYIGKPAEIDKIGAKPFDVKKEAGAARLKEQKFIYVEEISKALGAKW